MDYRNANTAAVAPAEPTINDRLNRVAEAIHDHCDRIECVLSRVNGTPQNEKAREVAQIRPTRALGMTVDSLEGAQTRLRELTLGVERIA